MTTPSVSPSLSPTTAGFWPLQRIGLFLLSIYTGLYAGLSFGGMVAPILPLMTIPTYAEYWQLLDTFMGARMPIFGNTWLMVYLFCIVVFIRQWRSPVFWVIVGSLVLTFADMLLTGLEQLPINRYIQSLDVYHLTPAQVEKLKETRAATFQHFNARQMLGVISFLAIQVATFFLPKR